MSAARPECVLPAALSPFADTLHEPGLARTAAETLRWLVAHSVPGVAGSRRLPALVTVASVYARLCAPAGASERCYEAAARFTLLFFVVDDASLTELPNLLGAGDSWSIGPYTPALRSWRTEFHEQQSATLLLRERFARAYHDYLAARRAEHEQKTRPLDLAQHWALRRRTIFMDPYLDMWMILLGIEVEALADAAFSRARGLAVDLVLLANDLGSRARDGHGGASPDDLNLIHTYVQERAVSEEQALEALIAEHNQLVERFRATLRQALAEQPGPHAERYADLLTAVVEGNVRSMRALPFRYPGAAPVLSRLLSVSV